MKSSKGYHGQPMAPVQYSFIGMCTKVCLTIINVFLGILGFGVVLCGAYGLYMSTVVEDNIRFDLEFLYLLSTYVSGAMVPMGTALVVVAVSGCIGACQENFAILKLYMWVLGIFLIIEICVIVGSFLLVWKAKEMMETSLPHSLVADYRPSTASVLDFLQSKVECCGLSIDGYQDYELNPLYNCNDMNQNLQRCSVPGSCCRPPDQRLPAPTISTAVSNDSFSCGQGALLLNLGRLVSESACERKDPGSNPAADMVDAARNTAWDLGKQPNNYRSNYPTQEWARRFVPIASFYSYLRPRQRAGARTMVYTEGCTSTLTYLLRMLLYAVVSFVVVCAFVKMYVVYQVRTLLNQIALLPYNHYSIY
ncbi:Tetraspanin/Peripherin [Trinorchestia longiramus]|nr:Tetraspanin/Peripherin [Trinorchestia longiramus]